MKKIKNPIILYYWANWLYRRNIPFLPRMFQILLFLIFKAVIPYQAKLGKDCLLSHGGVGTVIHPMASIGANVIIHHQVTIGGTGFSDKVPVIGDDVYIGAGAKILGPIEIGSNCVIGANAVVVSSVPSGCVVAGVPARILKENIDAHSIERW